MLLHRCLTSARSAFVPVIQLRPRRCILPVKGICTASIARSVVILGGTSGVGLETSRYLNAKGVETRTFSRSTGHDFANLADCKAAVDNAKDGVAVCIGAGQRQSSYAEEVALYENIASALQSVDTTLVVTVVRTLVLSEVARIFAKALSTPWVILRPGAMDFGSRQEHQDNTNSSDEKLLVTADMRCNGLVSRRGVARVAGDLLLRRIPVLDVNGKVLGVYDRNKMISKPNGCTFIGTDLWCDATN